MHRFCDNYQIHPSNSGEVFMAHIVGILAAGIVGIFVMELILDMQYTGNKYIPIAIGFPVIILVLIFWNRKKSE